jgi:hypothetical protein
MSFESGTSPRDKSWAVLQSLICLLREKNLLSRGDIEELCAKIEARARQESADELRCCPEGVLAAANEMQQLTDYIGRKYGGKHRRVQ